jgi:hypothetical protein
MLMTTIEQAEALGTLVLGLVVLIGFVAYFVKIAWELSKALTKLNVTLENLGITYAKHEEEIRLLKINDHEQDLLIKRNTVRIDYIEDKEDRSL